MKISVPRYVNLGIQWYSEETNAMYRPYDHRSARRKRLLVAMEVRRILLRQTLSWRWVFQKIL